MTRPATVPRIRSLCTGYGGLKLIDWAALDYAEILTAGYPCQPFSNAGKRQGIDDPRHIWPWIFEGIGVLRPRIVVLENVSAHLRRGFDVVAEDLASVGSDTAWSVVPASAVGAPHIRKRLFIVAEDTHSAAGGERWEPAPGQAQGGRSRPDAGGRGGVAATDADCDKRKWEPAQQPGRAATSRSGHLAADADRAGLEVGNGLDADERQAAAGGHLADAAGGQDWVQYSGAIRRWERELGRVAPAPTVMGARGGRVLSPFFVEWLMGLDAGHVTAVDGLSRNDQLHLLGNGVVPQQAEYAIRGLLPHLVEARSAA
jgi:DNA (cytosine-5)-methyltransferase 1